MTDQVNETRKIRQQLWVDAWKQACNGCSGPCWSAEDYADKVLERFDKAMAEQPTQSDKS